MCVRAVAYAEATDVSALLDGADPDEVFSPAERVHCAAGGRSLHRWAGRLAAKRAVLGLVELPGNVEHLRSVVVVPGPHECPDPTVALCRMGHRPVVHLHGPVDAAWQRRGAAPLVLSISHDGGLAVAVAILGPG